MGTCALQRNKWRAAGLSRLRLSYDRGSMLREITNTKQVEGEPLRRWFSGENIDLYVWYAKNEIEQFQICTDRGSNERALTWTRDSGISVHAVDDGESGVFRMKSSPVLAGRAGMDLDSLRKSFAAAAQKLEHDLYTFIMTRLEGH